MREPLFAQLLPPAWRKLVNAVHGSREFRDEEDSCDVFERGDPSARGDCETDGHYMCLECVHISEREYCRRKDLCWECGAKLAPARSGRSVGQDPEVCPACDPAGAFVENHPDREGEGP